MFRDQVRFPNSDILHDFFFFLGNSNGIFGVITKDSAVYFLYIFKFRVIADYLKAEIL